MTNPPPTNVFAAKKSKLGLPAMFAENPEKMEILLFLVEQYCLRVDVKKLDSIKLADVNWVSMCRQPVQELVLMQVRAPESHE